MSFEIEEINNNEMETYNINDEEFTLKIMIYY